ncbi:NucA/NucB deoxyribonuclease domain-containing protein [Streptomyces hundungensis]|uniref:NucA/NucB deoxyribonuclease domain-containing protein n=1 Tax=Streptomyces TaxID=1883 RepID=UPI003CD086B3
MPSASRAGATALPPRFPFPDVGDNFDNALANGDIPTVNRLVGRSNIRANRNAAQAGLPRPDSLGTDVNGGKLSWEEYPFASTTQGGSGAVSDDAGR